MTIVTCNVPAEFVAYGLVSVVGLGDVHALCCEEMVEAASAGQLLEVALFHVAEAIATHVVSGRCDAGGRRDVTDRSKHLLRNNMLHSASLVAVYLVLSTADNSMYGIDGRGLSNRQRYM